MKIRMQITSPTGIPMQLEISPDDNGKEIIGLLERAEAMGEYLSNNGWAIDEPTRGPGAQEAAQGPTFCGYPCSPTADDRGLPTWILVNGHQAHRREKQGDVWYSYKEGEEYIQALRIPKGETPPKIQGLD